MKYTVVFSEGSLKLEVGNFSDLEKAVEFGINNSGNGVEFEVKIVK